MSESQFLHFDFPLNDVKYVIPNNGEQVKKAVSQNQKVRAEDAEHGWP